VVQVFVRTPTGSVPRGHQHAITSKAISRLVFDLSYERRGALLCVLETTNKITDLVPDHKSDNRPNRPLRETSRQLNAAVERHRRMLKNIAAIDGAMVTDRRGKVIDVACMISDPSDEELRSNGLRSRERFSGARSTAAWNASIFGLALKVSEDGPVTVYRSGKRGFELAKSENT
jgi:DNA integrity scanning protein DisA with diadenylate cyclase activity